jgi:glycosyltransferase involved in cell wall biosynthesis
MEFKIITTQRNAEAWLPKCIDSLRSQVGETFDVCLCDDASDDNSAQIIKDAARQSGWHAIIRGKQMGALRNQVDGIRLMDPKPEDVIVFVDGDDWLPHPNVLERLCHHYSDGTLVAYGQYESIPFSPTCSLAGPYPQDVIDAGAYRKYTLDGRGIPWNHIRTFKYEVFAQLDDADFKDDNGNWYMAAPDAVLLYPCLELAQGRVKFMDEVLYCYNSENPISEWRIDPRLSSRVHQHVLHRPRKRP